ncbi:MAG: hypothetical protein R3B93_26165 [Bacteroidia bacterium]
MHLYLKQILFTWLFLMGLNHYVSAQHLLPNEVVFTYKIIPHRGFHKYRMRQFEHDGKWKFTLIPVYPKERLKMPIGVFHTTSWRNDTLFTYLNDDHFHWREDALFHKHLGEDTLISIWGKVTLLNQKQYNEVISIFKFRVQNQKTEGYTDITYLEGVGCVRIDVVKSLRYPQLNYSWILDKINDLPANEYIKTNLK